MTINLRLTFIALLSLLVCNASLLRGQDNKQLQARRITNPPKIDGLLTEKEWRKAGIAKDFIQNSPEPGKKSSLETEVRVLYDDISVYIGATLFDVAQDSILQEITRRDRGGIVDMFGVLIDTYDNDQDAFEFFVSAAGVQIDARRSPVGRSTSWNAAWRSEVQIEGSTWYVEMEIPFSAIRFPKKDIQKWGINFFRAIRRKNEFVYWNEVDPNVDGFVNQFGTLTGIKNVKSPVRLQISPYISGYVDHQSADGDKPARFSQSMNYGMDLKYGINDAFTLDMMLIPDFGQVQSDNQVLNLSPFEIQFAENRQFFTEGTELFNKGDFFYSRRIGGTPINRGKADDDLAEGEIVTSNPRQSNLINASKISGRTPSGLGVGVLNAMTSAMYAEVENEAGETRKVRTAPFTNYSVVAIDQSFRNNSFVTLLNTNVTRADNTYDANLIGTAFRWANKENSFAVSGKFGYSSKFGGERYSEKAENGHTSSLTLSKIGGNLRFGFTNYMESDTYDPNDLGFLRANNEFRNSAFVSYNIFEPFGKFLSFSTRLNVMHQMLYNPAVFTNLRITGNVIATLENFFTNSFSWGMYPVERYDYFEPRVEGRVFVRPKARWLGYWFGTDSRKRVRLSGNVSYATGDLFDYESLTFSVTPRFRVNNKLSFTTSMRVSNEHDDIGYVSKSGDEQEVNFGLRDINTFTNTVTTKYTFNNKMDLFFRMRHYWSAAEYTDFFELGQEGDLLDSSYENEHDRNFNAFNIDMVYTWVFAPASEVSVVWKNAILADDGMVRDDYFENVSELMQNPQANSLSVRVLYLLDYSMLKKAKQNKSVDRPLLAGGAHNNHFFF